MDHKILSLARWIWLPETQNDSDVYGIFRKEFFLSGNPASPVFIHIAADSKFELWINGVHCPAEQYPDLPPERTVSTCDITSLLRPGKNLVAARIYHIGEKFSTYCPGEAGFAAAVTSGETLLLTTDASWKCSQDRSYKQNARILVSTQLAYTFEYNAETADNSLTDPEDDLTGWQSAAESESVFNFIPRPVPQLKISAPPQVTLKNHGFIRRSGTYQSPAQDCMHDFSKSEFDCRNLFENITMLSREQFAPLKLRFDDPTCSLKFKPLPDDADGWFVIVDPGMEYAGFLTLDIEADSGCCIDICHGEHLDDGHVRMAPGYRNFADRYICRQGRNRFRHTLRRVGCRFIELHITRVTGTVILHYAGITPTDAVLPAKTEFETPEKLLCNLIDSAEYTLQMCMHEHYEDCPWREQALYPGDSRFQMLYGYPVWGNYKFATANLQLIGKSYSGGGQLPMTAPAKAENSRSIPVYTLQWINALNEYLMYSGDTELFREFLPVVQEIFEFARQNRDAASGLYLSGSQDNIWDFYEWNPQLEKMDARLHSAWNLHLAEALLNAANSCRAIGCTDIADNYQKSADEIANNIKRSFFVDSESYFRLLPAGDDNGAVFEYIQNLAGMLGLFPTTQRPADKPLIETELSSMYYYLKSAINTSPAARAAILPRIYKLYAPMLATGNRTLWETTQGAAAFLSAGSLCHGWSALPVYLAKSFILGVTPLTPGFGKAMIKPLPFNLPQAAGTVPTPHGEIQVQWQLEGGKVALNYSAPPQVEIVLDSYPEYPVIQK